MNSYVKNFWEDEEGDAVVSTVLVIAALIAVALLFREKLMQFAGDLMDKVFNTNAADGNT